MMLTETVHRSGLAELLAFDIIEHRNRHRADGMEAEGIPLDGNVCPTCGRARRVARGAGCRAGLARVSFMVSVRHIAGGLGLSTEALVTPEAAEDAVVVVMVVDGEAEHVLTRLSSFS